MNIFAEQECTYRFIDQEPTTTGILNIVAARDGYYKEIKNNVLTTYKKVEEIKELSEINSSLYFNLPKIPFSIFCTLRQWFKSIYVKYKTESSAFVVWNYTTEEYEIFIPEQKNTGATSDYQMGASQRFMEYINGKELVMVCHSHPWKSSSVGPSGTDNRDEKEPILYLILSNVEEIPVYYLSTVIDGERQKLNLFDIFENPLASEFGNVNLSEKAKELLNKIDEKDILLNFVKDVEIPYDEWEKFVTANIFRSTGIYNNNFYSYNNSFYNTNKYERFKEDHFGKQTSLFDEQKAISDSLMLSREDFYDADSDVFGDMVANIVDKKENTVYNKVEPSIEYKYQFLLNNEFDDIDVRKLENGEYSIPEVNEMYEKHVDDVEDMPNEEEIYFKTYVESMLKNPVEDIPELFDCFAGLYIPFDEIIDELDLDESISIEQKRKIVENYAKLGLKDDYDIRELTTLEKVLFCINILSNMKKGTEIKALKGKEKYLLDLLQKEKFSNNIYQKIPKFDTLLKVCEEIHDKNY